MTAPFRSAAFKLTCIYLFVWFKFLARASVSLFSSSSLLCDQCGSSIRPVPQPRYPDTSACSSIFGGARELSRSFKICDTSTLSLSLTYSLARCVLQRVPAVEKKNTTYTRYSLRARACSASPPLSLSLSRSLSSRVVVGRRKKENIAWVTFIKGHMTESRK